MNTIFHYPPELLSLLVDALSRLCKSKKDVLLFFQGSGVSKNILAPYEILLKTNKDSFKKPIVAREILSKLNEKEDKYIRERREIIKRVTEFHEFSVCWEADQAVARGLVAQVRELVNVKDAFTRMNIERDRELQQSIDDKKRKTDNLNKKKQSFADLRKMFFALFNESNPYNRGKALETVLNRYFHLSDILISEAITLKGDLGAGIIEQIDGVVQIRGQLYLVEVKWEQESLGREKVASHLVRVFSRGLAGGIFISYSNYSNAAISDCKEALRDKVIVLCTLDEFVQALEQEISLSQILENKINAAIIHKTPFSNLKNRETS